MRTVIFGLGALSSLAWYCLLKDSEHEVLGFAVDRAFRHQDKAHDLPVVDFETLEERFPADHVALLIPTGARGMNTVRRDHYRNAKARGYRFVNYVSSRAATWPDLTIGENVMIYEGAVVQPFAAIGDNCILRSGCHVSHHARIGDHCFIAAHAVVAGSAVVGEACFLGVNATVIDGVKVAPRCLIGAGALVTRDTAADGVYVGSPARRAAGSSADHVWA